MDYSYMLYSVLAWYNGENQVPQLICRTGCYNNALKTARDVYKEYGCKIIIKNNKTGQITEIK